MKKKTNRKMPLISIVILSYNEKKWIPKLINSLKKQTYKNYEIIIADNNSTDGTDRFVYNKFPSVKIVNNTSNLGTPGYNPAVQKARGKYIFFIATDMEVDKQCLKELVNLMQNDEKIALAAPKVVNFYDHSKVDVNGTWLSHSFYGGAIRNHELKQATEAPFYGIGLIRKSVVEKIGYLYDPDYFLYGEDVDLCMKIRLMGMKVVAVPSAVIYHYGFQAQKIWTKGYLTFLIERNQLTNFVRTFSPVNVLFYSPLVFGARIAVFFKDLIKLDFQRAGARLAAVAWVLTHPSYILAKRKASQALRKVNDRYIFEVMSEKYLLKVVKHNLTGTKW